MDSLQCSGAEAGTFKTSYSASKVTVFDPYEKNVDPESVYMEDP